MEEALCFSPFNESDYDTSCRPAHGRYLFSPLITAMFPMGGVSPVRPATAEIQCICNKMKPQVEMKDGRNFQCFRAIVFTSQVLAGTNYFIKVDVGHDECLHLRIYQDLNGQRLLNSYQSDKTQFCPLTYF